MPHENRLRRILLRVGRILVQHMEHDRQRPSFVPEEPPDEPPDPPLSVLSVQAVRHDTNNQIPNKIYFFILAIFSVYAVPPARAVFRYSLHGASDDIRLPAFPPNQSAFNVVPPYPFFGDSVGAANRHAPHPVFNRVERILEFPAAYRPPRSRPHEAAQTAPA